MKSIHPHELEKHLTQKLNYFYIFLGEDFFLSSKNQDLILCVAQKQGFLEKFIINIENSKDWEKVIFFYQSQSLFFQKTILIINLEIKKLNISFTNQMQKIFPFLNSNILMILKFNHLSFIIQKNKIFNKLKNYSNIVSCFTPYSVYFINWINYEIKQKNINLEKKAFFLLCKYYEGNTLFICQILDIILITWPNTCITEEKIKKIIIDFFNFYPSHWINAILQGQIEKAIHILNILYKQKYNPLILMRILQKDLLKLIYIKREQNINIKSFLNESSIHYTRHKFFESALNKISYNNLFKAIRILVKIEINIKQKYNHSVWDQLQKLTLTLN